MQSMSNIFETPDVLGDMMLMPSHYPNFISHDGCSLLLWQVDPQLQAPGKELRLWNLR